METKQARRQPHQSQQPGQRIQPFEKHRLSSWSAEVREPVAEPSIGSLPFVGHGYQPCRTGLVCLGHPLPGHPCHLHSFGTPGWRALRLSTNRSVTCRSPKTWNVAPGTWNFLTAPAGLVSRERWSASEPPPESPDPGHRSASASPPPAADSTLPSAAPPSPEPERSRPRLRTTRKRKVQSDCPEPENPGFSRQHGLSIR